jgi:phosphoglycerate dehydrogenase-like enzyme
MGELPAEVDLHLIARGAPLESDIDRAQFLVPPYNSLPLLERLASMRELRVIQAVSAGIEWLLPWVPDGVTLCNARGTRDLAVAEWVIAVILTMEKRLLELASHQRQERWRPQLLAELAGKRALVLGYGSVGERIANRLTALDIQVRAVASRERAGVHGVDALQRLLPDAEIVVLAVPLTQQTQGLFDERMLTLMRPGALLVNVSRGAVLDTAALVERLSAGHIRAALDVTDPEPLPPGHPLWRAAGVLITPHLAGDTPQSEERVYRLIGDQIRRYVNGQPLLNVIGSCAP